jgi:soluble lytic murein transglycosylase-like protein/murein DD-endopeptidase MepM/ murein hydrolase activator NlpD
MKKRKLLIGLSSAGVLLAGFGGTVLPASADRVFDVQLSSGQVVRVTVPDGKTLAEVVPGAIVSATEVGPASAPAQTPAPTTTQPSATTPAQAPAPTSAQPGKGPTPQDGQGNAAKPTDVPQGGQVEQQGAKAADRAKAKARAAARRRAAAKAKAEAEKAKREAQAQADAAAGAPTASDPTFSLALPGAAAIGVPNFFIDKFRIPPFLLPIYQAAGIQYGVRWEVLAAINEIETDYGRNLNVSTAGAVGWMQFLPSTWEMYGVDANDDGRKDPYNPVDAIFAAARYLKAAGADQDVRRAIFAYNHADWYVESVLLRARLIGGLPTDLVGSLTGLTQGHFPVYAKARYADDLTKRDAERKVAAGRNAAVPVESTSTRRGIRIYAKAGAPVVATQDGRIVKVGTSQRLGRFVQLRDVYGNTYTYGQLKSLARAYPVPRERKVTETAVQRELKLPAADPKPTAPASAGQQRAARATRSSATTGKSRLAANGTATSAAKERVFANPSRPGAFKAGGEDQLMQSGAALGNKSFRSYFTQVYGLKRSEVRLKHLKVGSRVIAGTILGHIGRTVPTVAPNVLFEVRPAGRGAPRIDPKPILDGWKLLESTAIYRAAGKNPFFGPDARNPSIGQVLMMSKEALQRTVLQDPRIDLYSCGRRDIRAGVVDRRVLATLEFLASSGLKPTVTSLRCGHGYLTASGNVSEHSSGSAVDIAAVNGIPILGHQGEGSITDIAIRRLLTLQGTMKPHQIISLMTFDGADNTMALPDHADHIHVGFHPLFGDNTKLGQQLGSVLKPGQWTKLISRLGQIDNPTVRVAPSKYAIKVKRPQGRQGD